MPQATDPNSKRNLRNEARQVVLDAIDVSRTKKKPADQIDAVMRPIADWAGSTDKLLVALGKPALVRPQAVFDGISDALEELDPAQMSVHTSLALISTLNAVRDRVESWKSFVGRTHEYYRVIRPDDADELLQGFI